MKIRNKKKIIMIIITIVITMKIRATFLGMFSFYFYWRSLYFPWDRIYWIKEGLSNYGKAFIIPWNLLKPVSIKLKERHGKP